MISPSSRSQTISHLYGLSLYSSSASAFEISSRYRPHERFVRRAYDRGLRLALGSDGHTHEQVGNIAFSLSVARSIGIPEAELYDPFVHGSRGGAKLRAR